MGQKCLWTQIWVIWINEKCHRTQNYRGQESNYKDKTTGLIPAEPSWNMADLLMFYHCTDRCSSKLGMGGGEGQ